LALFSVYSFTGLDFAVPAPAGTASETNTANVVMSADAATRPFVRRGTGASYASYVFLHASSLEVSAVELAILDATVPDRLVDDEVLAIELADGCHTLPLEVAEENLRSVLALTLGSTRSGS
jgi:hypothetical protein